LFQPSNPDGLAKSATQVYFFGEVGPAQEPIIGVNLISPWGMGQADSFKTDAEGDPLDTDPEWEYAAYMRNLNFLDVDGNPQRYHGNEHWVTGDKPFGTNCHFDDQGPRGSWLQYGGRRGWWSRVIISQKLGIFFERLFGRDKSPPTA
jgi:hypothetical protein